MTRSNETCSKCGGNRWNGTVVGDYCLRCDGTGVDPKYGSGDMKALVAEVERLRAENRRLRDVLEWTHTQCPSKCAGVCDEALREKPSSLVEELLLLRGELQEHARLAGMGSEREARLMAQLEEARKELQGVMEALPVTTVAFTGDYGLYVRACVDYLLEQERESIVRFLRQPPEKAKACDKPHRHEDGKPCVVLVPVDLDEAAALIEQGKHLPSRP